MEKNNANLLKRLVNNSWDKPPVSREQAKKTIEEFEKKLTK